MKLALMQPYFFPYLGYFQLIHSCDRFVFYDDVNFIKGGWINRNRIVNNNTVSYIGLQMENASAFKHIRDIQVNSGDLWKNKLIKTVSQAYARAPYVKQAVGLLNDTLFSAHDSLSEFASESILQVLKYVNLEVEIVESSVIYNNAHLHGEERVINICNLNNATIYRNSAGGMELYSKENFNKAGIQLTFVKPQITPYKQRGEVFEAGLSILDVLMYNSPDETMRLMTQYEIIE